MNILRHQSCQDLSVHLVSASVCGSNCLEIRKTRCHFKLQHHLNSNHVNLTLNHFATLHISGESHLDPLVINMKFSKSISWQKIMQLLQRQHHMPCLCVWSSQKCWKPLYKLQHHKLSFQPCISQVRHTPPPKEGDVPFNQKYSLKALTEWHLRPKNHFLILKPSFSRIEARKAWLASVSTVFHYTTLYWNQYIDILILILTFILNHNAAILIETKIL